MLQLLQGYRTYIVGGLAVAIGVYMQNVELILTGLGFMGLRAAINNKQ